jgi:hypothetical protein
MNNSYNYIKYFKLKIKELYYLLLKFDKSNSNLLIMEIFEKCLLKINNI